MDGVLQDRDSPRIGIRIHTVFETLHKDWSNSLSAQDKFMIRVLGERRDQVSQVTLEFRSRTCLQGTVFCCCCCCSNNVLGSCQSSKNVTSHKVEANSHVVWLLYIVERGKKKKLPEQITKDRAVTALCLLPRSSVLQWESDVGDDTSD